MLDSLHTLQPPARTLVKMEVPAPLLAHVTVLLDGQADNVKQVLLLCMSSNQKKLIYWFCCPSLNCGKQYHCPLILKPAATIDCGNPGIPQNAYQDLPSTTLGSQVTYHCMQGYVLVGEGTRECTDNGLWSGSLPTCQCEFTQNCLCCEVNQALPQR